MFIGANEGFPMEGARGREVECCAADWAALYANRARRMVDTYRQGGSCARVLDHGPHAARPATAPKISRVVNAAVRVAAQPWASQVRVIDTRRVRARAATRTRSTIDGRAPHRSGR